MAIVGKLKLNNSSIKNLERAKIVALEKTAESLKTRVLNEQVIPKDVGTLQDSLHVDYSESKKGKVSLVMNTPYARRLYYHPEYNFSKTDNVNAQGKWFEPWLSGKYKDFAQKRFNEFYKRESGV